MTTSRFFHTLPSRGRRFAPKALAIASFLLLVNAPPAGAQIVKMGSNALLTLPILRGTATAYDPIHQAYLSVEGQPGLLLGVCTNAAGQATSAAITIMGNPGLYGTFPHVKFSPQSPDGAGGAGSFLVSWVQTDGPGATAVHARLVSCSPAVYNAISADQLLSDYSQGGAYFETGGSAISYSPTSQRFVVLWQTWGYAIQGRFVDVNGNAIGGVMQITNPGGTQLPGVAWNPATDAFGISYAGWNNSGAFVGFVLLGASNGSLSGRSSFGFSSGTYVTDVAVNRNTNNFVMGWSPGGGVLFQEFNPSGGATGAAGLMTSAFGSNDSFSLDFNPVSGTFLGVGQSLTSYEIAGVEANMDGFPIGTAALLTSGTGAPGSYYPRVTARTDAAQWGFSYSARYTTLMHQIVATGTTGGGTGVPTPTSPSPPPPPSNSGCSTPDPFAAMGGGTCISGGWHPPGSAPAPTAPPPPTPTPTPPPSGGCTTANPFAAMGTGVCVNGGWQFGSPAAPPPPTPAPPPPPTPAPTAPPSGGCTTPNPFASMGMGLCVNGGWQFLPMAAPTPSNSDGTCTTPDPFVAQGGGICRNGGWTPSNSAPVFCSGLPDPFSAFGGGVCINGGWHMRGGD